LKWAKQLQALSQNGLTYAQDPFDRERYEQIRQIAAEMLAEQAGLRSPFVFAQGKEFFMPSEDEARAKTRHRL